MKKALVLAVCIFALAGSQMVSADNAGLGFMWNVGPTIPLTSNFTMQGFSNRFDLGWQIGDTMTIGVFNEAGSLRAQMSYTNTINYQETYNGTINMTGLDINSTIPGLDMLSAGIEMGVARAQDTSDVFTRNGAAGAFATDFGTPASLTGSYPVIGLRGKWAMLSAKSKGLWSEVDLAAAVRFIPVPDCNVLGYQETNAAGGASSISAVNNLNSVDVSLGVTIGF